MPCPYKSVEDMPAFMTPADLSKIMRISRNGAYALVHSEGFPSIQVGKQYRIPKNKFILWLNTAA